MATPKRYRIVCAACSRVTVKTRCDARYCGPSCRALAAHRRDRAELVAYRAQAVQA